MTITKSNNTFAGHRQRLKTRFLNDPQLMADYELLELFLGYALLRKDTKPLAKELLARFGSLSQVLQARKEELEQVEGFGMGVWTLWLIFRECLARTATAPLLEKEVLASPQTIARVAQKRLFGISHEECWIALVDTGLRCLGWEKLMQGSIDSIPISPRDVIAKVLQRNAYGFILVHNHPSGCAKASRPDLILTEQLRQLSPHMDITFIEHIIITEKECRSILSGLVF